MSAEGEVLKVLSQAFRSNSTTTIVAINTFKINCGLGAFKSIFYVIRKVQQVDIFSVKQARSVCLYNAPFDLLDARSLMVKPTDNVSVFFCLIQFVSSFSSHFILKSI